MLYRARETFISSSVIGGVISLLSNIFAHTLGPASTLASCHSCSTTFLNVLYIKHILIPFLYIYIPANSNSLIIEA